MHTCLQAAITFGARHLHPTAHESFLFPGNPLGDYYCLVSNDPGHNHSSFELVCLRLWEKRHFIRSFDGYITICRQPSCTILSSSDVCCSTEPISCTGQREITLQGRRKRLVSEDLGRVRDTILPATGNHSGINSLVLDAINDCTQLRRFISDDIPRASLDYGGVEPTSRLQVKRQRSMHCGW